MLHGWRLYFDSFTFLLRDLYMTFRRREAGAPPLANENIYISFIYDASLIDNRALDIVIIYASPMPPYYLFPPTKFSLP